MNWEYYNYLLTIVMISPLTINAMNSYHTPSLNPFASQ